LGGGSDQGQAPQDQGGDPIDNAAAAVAADGDNNTAGSASSYVATPAPGAPGNQPVNTDDLLDIKQHALQELSPLVGHLEQTPEEKFRTTMMMIQASDNHALVREAYDAAKEIANEKDRAQALLDIINEINYFTQHGQSS
jgi:hypothetical protein